ncbi:hypothetical protein CQW35_02672 [Bacteroides fragilis]|uniref:Uncharacterized protein n=1 Tax=Bacteroides fragilis TaxID=817 RepID=A0A853PPF7_BACFG|nr:hypothetical protein M075_4171 [Bacteroides fragilis str. 20793-3]OCR27874.1 hypothetical protein AC094_40600 [Bacteroides fragilis]PJY65466.1 hypothetical protein CQW35_02672 [Bacteroides fragilis]
MVSLLSLSALYSLKESSGDNAATIHNRKYNPVTLLKIFSSISQYTLSLSIKKVVHFKVWT